MNNENTKLYIDVTFKNLPSEGRIDFCGVSLELALEVLELIYTKQQELMQLENKQRITK